jgi:hypothetical protein
VLAATACDSGAASDARAIRPNEQAATLLPGMNEAALPVLGRLHMLMLRANQSAREAQRKAEEQFEIEERIADAARLKEMRDKADASLTSGLLSGALQLGGGVASAAAASNTLARMTERDLACRRVAEFEREAARAQDEGRDVAALGLRVASKLEHERVAPLEVAVGKAAQTEKIVDASGKSFEGVRTGVEALGRVSADRAQVRIVEHENTAKSARRTADRLKNEQEALKQSDSRLMQLAAEIARACQESQRAALLKM